MNPKIEEIVKALRYEAYMWRGNDAAAVCFAAADLIQQLQQELSKLKEQQRWIPVTDCPKADGQYLVTCRSFGGQWTSTLGFARVGEDVDDYDLRGKRNVWYDYDSEYGYVAVNFVTHWKPLPEPPKEEVHESERVPQGN